MNVTDWSSRVRRIRNLIKQSPVPVLSGHFSALVAAGAGIATYGNLVSATAFMTVGVSLATYVVNNTQPDNLVYRFGGLLHNKHYAKKVMLEALETLHQVVHENPNGALERGLMNIRAMKIDQKLGITRIGARVNISEAGVLFDDVFSKDLKIAHDLIIQECLYAYIIDHKCKNTFLPKNTQNYILERFPEWVITAEEMFEADTISKKCPDLMQAIIVVKGLDYAQSEQLDALRNWLSISTHVEPAVVELPNIVM